MPFNRLVRCIIVAVSLLTAVGVVTFQHLENQEQSKQKQIQNSAMVSE